MRRPVTLRGGLAALLALGVALAAAGCASEPPRDTRRTTVLLLPDDDGQVGAVSVAAAGGTEDIRHAYQASIVQGGAAAPARAQAVDPAAIERRHGPLLKARPTAPKTFVVYFVVDKATLTEESIAQLPLALQAIRERKPTEITIFGHADATGSHERNLRLSAERARAVADWLHAADPTLDRIGVQYFGDSRPMTGDAAQLNPARNRRAEIQIL